LYALAKSGLLALAAVPLLRLEPEMMYGEQEEETVVSVPPWLPLLLLLPWLPPPLRVPAEDGEPVPNQARLARRCAMRVPSGRMTMTDVWVSEADSNLTHLLNSRAEKITGSVGGTKG
jgi:hypothetical protein